MNVSAITNNRIFGSLLCLLVLLLPFDRSHYKWSHRFSFTPSGVSLPAWFDKKLSFYFTDLLSVALFILAIYIYRAPLRQWLFASPGKWLWSFFFLCFASILASPLFTLPAAYWHLLQLLTPLLLFFSVLKCQKTWINPIFWCLVIGGALQALFAIVQYSTQQPLGLYCLGETSHRFLAGEIPSPMGALTRASGTFKHANPLGGFLVTAIFAAFALYAESKKKLILGFIALMILGIILTFSRSAFFAGLLGSFIFFWKAHPPRILLWFTIGSFLLIGSLFHQRIWDRGGIINYNLRCASADVPRISQNKIALETIARHPFLGVGFQQFPPIPIQVHNTPLLIAAETGIFSLLCISWFVLSILRKSLFASLSIPGIACLSMILAWCFIMNTDFYPFLFPQIKTVIFLALGLLVAEISKNHVTSSLQKI